MTAPTLSPPAGSTGINLRRPPDDPTPAIGPEMLAIQSGPRNARTDANGLRYYTWHGRELPSVTTIQRMAGVPHNLHQWAISQVIERAVEQYDVLTSMLSRERRPRERVLEKNRREEASKWLRQGATEKRDISAALGTAVHDAAASRRPLDAVPDEVRPRLRQAYDWWRVSGAEELASEFQVFNLSIGYAGTCDLLVRLRDGSIWLVDLKTGDGIYTDHLLQVLAYSMAEVSGSDGVVDRRVTDLLLQVRGIAVLHLADDHWEFRAFRPDAAAWAAFRGLLTFAVWQATHDLVSITAAVKRGEAPRATPDPEPVALEVAA